MLSAHKLDCARGGRVVLGDLSLDLMPGELLGVLGANGAGKTSLLCTLAGELPPHAGDITLDGRALRHCSPDQLARRRAVLPQSSTLSFDLSVREVVAMGAYPFPELSPGAHEALLREALRQADAASFTERRYLTLSGGEQQRVQFARVLMQLLACRADGEYRMLLLDEPTASLDPKHQWMLLEVVSRLTRQDGIAALIVMHDVNLAARWCDRLLLLARGQVAALGTPREVLTAPILQSVYDLPAHVINHPDDATCPLVLFGAHRHAA
ncbi:MAG: heme ABC transporter ATP-binding protein [Rhodocyclaceae bacterium]